MNSKNSYAQIFKSSFIMGGAAGINLLLGMVRVKFAAVFLGSAGVGLNANFTAVQGLIGTIAGLGIQSSAVREVAAAVGKGDQQAIGRAVLTLRRICWLTGLVGMAAMMLLSPLISELTFGSRDYVPDIVALGIIILFGNLSGGQIALIQGMRRLGDMGRANVFGAAFGTVAALGFYATIGLRGIVPALVIVSALQLALSWFFARKVPVPAVSLTWRQTFAEAGDMVKLGLVMMWNGLMISAVSYITITLITQQAGVDGVGIYSSAFALSGIFVNFVLGAMGADYYPRLTAVATDNGALNRLVNEQTEIGLLLALPGLLATMVLAPWLVRVFYTSEFLPAVGLVQWFILGCLGRVISWPLGYVMLALGKGRWFLLTETGANLLHIVLIAIGLSLFGIEGVAIAFFALYIGYAIIVYAVCRSLTGFRWSRAARHIAWRAVSLLAIVFVMVINVPVWPASAVGSVFTLVASLYALRSLLHRIGADHPIARAVNKIPGLRAVCSCG